MTKTKKMLAALLAALAVCTALFATTAFAEEKTEMQLGCMATTMHVTAFVAKEEGFFDEEGLDVTINKFSSANEIASALEAGKLDVAFFGAGPVITFQSNGHELSVFGGAQSNGHGYVIKQASAEEGRTGLELLINKNVAVAKNSLMDYELQILLADAGIEIGKGDGQVHVQYFSTPAECYAALSNAEIDAGCVFSPYIARAAAEGYRAVYLCAELEELENQPCCRQIAETSRLNSDPETFKAFERAIIRAYQFVQENHEKTIEDARQYVKLDHDLLEKELYAGYGTLNPDPGKQTTVKFKNDLLRIGIIEDYDIEPYFNLEIYRDALNSLIEEYPDEAVYRELAEHFAEWN